MGFTSKESGEDGLLRARLEDAVTLSEVRSCPRFVGFMDERQRAVAEGYLKHLKKQNSVIVRFYGGYEEAERTICGVFPSFIEPADALFPLTALAIRYRTGVGLTHRDFLGALLSCGVQRKKIGDILCGDGLTVVFADEEIAPFLCEQLTVVKAEGVQMTSGYVGELPATRQYHAIRDTVASPRLDAVVKACIGSSREEAARCIAAGLVSLNHLPCLTVSTAVKAGDCLSIRGRGRYLVDSIGPPSRKGRLLLSARKCV